MNTPSARMWVLVGKKFCCVKIAGRGNFNSSIDFKTLVNELREKGCAYFVLDLSECSLMDSTFLGVLAGFGLNLKPANKDSCDEGIELLNPNARIVELLESLGVLHLFKVTQGPLVAPEPAGLAAALAAALPVVEPAGLGAGLLAAGAELEAGAAAPPQAASASNAMPEALNARKPRRLIAGPGPAGTSAIHILLRVLMSPNDAHYYKSLWLIGYHRGQ